MMTWNELTTIIQRMTPSERQKTVKLFDYGTKRFFDPTVCFDGRPPVHLTIDTNEGHDDKPKIEYRKHYRLKDNHDWTAMARPRPGSGGEVVIVSRWFKNEPQPELEMFDNAFLTMYERVP